MYVLELNMKQRDYLLSLLDGRAGMAAELAVRLKSAPDSFGVVMWTNEDIASALREYGLRDTNSNVRAVRASYQSRHMEDLTIEHGWSLLEDAVSTLDR